MPWTIAGKIVAPTHRDISIVGQTIIQLTSTDVTLRISSVTGDAPRLVQFAPDVVEEGRTIILWNDSLVTVELGPPLTGYEGSDFDLSRSSFGHGAVRWFRYYIDGGPPGSRWPGWYQL